MTPNAIKAAVDSLGLDKHNVTSFSVTPKYEDWDWTYHVNVTVVVDPRSLVEPEPAKPEPYQVGDVVRDTRDGRIMMVEIVELEPDYIYCFYVSRDQVLRHARVHRDYLVKVD